MASDLWASISSQWNAIWQAFANAGALANAIQIVAGAIAVLSTAHWYVRRRLKDKEGQILDLKDDLTRRDKKLDELREQLAESKRICLAIQSQLPSAALYGANQEKEEGNYDKANQILLEWLRSAGRPISEVLLQMAYWAAAHSVGELRGCGLVTAEAYAIAATIFDRGNQSGLDLAQDIERLNIEEGQELPSLTVALKRFDGYPSSIFDIERVSEGAAAELEARQLYERGHYDLALPIIERAVLLLVQSFGKNALQTLEAERWKAYTLIALGYSEKALPIARAVADARRTNPAVGPSHPNTLASRHLVAEILNRLERSEEALSIARAVADAEEASPALGPSHPNTLTSRHLVAQILHTLGRNEEALSIARAVADARRADPALGPSHPDTLASRFLIAQVLNELGRSKEALPIARAVADARSPALGPSHPHTLLSRRIVADILQRLGRGEEALSIARAVAAAAEANPALGPLHPDTLASRDLAARILFTLGRGEEALSIARAVAAAAEASPALGPSHPTTLASRDVVARILHTLGRSEEIPSSTRAADAAEGKHSNNPRI